MKFYVVIPARYDSSRFPGKVLANIGSKSMLQHVFDNAINSDASDVFIATDSNKVFDNAKKFTKNIFLTSKKNINGTERVAELANTLKWDDDTLVINLQADMPELKPDNINFLAKKAKNNIGLSTLYYNLKDLNLISDRNTVKISVDENNINFYREVSENMSRNIYKHIGIYAYFVKDLNSYKILPQSINEKNLSLEQFRFLDNGYSIQAYCAVSDPGVSVDSSDNLTEIKGINN